MQKRLDVDVMPVGALQRENQWSYIYLQRWKFGHFSRHLQPNIATGDQKFEVSRHFQQYIFITFIVKFSLSRNFGDEIFFFSLVNFRGWRLCQIVVSSQPSFLHTIVHYDHVDHFDTIQNRSSGYFPTVLNFSFVRAQKQNHPPPVIFC